MAVTYSLTLAAPTQHLRQLTLIRTLLLGCLWTGLAASLWFNISQIPYGKIAYLLAVFTALHCLTYLRLHRELVVTEFEFFIQLLLDVICLNILFFFSGGATNPFISYLLVPICISAATLPWRFTWAITSLCLLTYTLLLFFHIELPIFSVAHAHMQSGLSIHIIGMWFNFFFSAMLITYFVVNMALNLRKQDDALNQLREDELRNEQLMAVAMLAAGAAHEMNTPLSTMTVLLSELQTEHKNNPLLLADLSILKSQVNYCANTLKHLVHESSDAHERKFKQQGLNDFCELVINRWQLMRPTIEYSLNIMAESKCTIMQDPRLMHAIINLLNNAADANPKKIKIDIICEANELIWKITDFGQGITQHINNKLGKTILSTKAQGMGIGMLLTYATVKSYAGHLTQIPNQPSGTITELRLPIIS